MLKKIKKNFIRGLYVVLPITLTFYLFTLAINFIAFHLQFIHRFLPISFLKNIPYSEIVIFICILIGIGKISELFQVERILQIIEKHILKKIPVISSIYNGIKQITKTLKKSDQLDPTTNNTVAWVKIPHQGFFALAFYAGELENQYSPEKNKKYYSFFLPSTPNPMTGHYIIAAEGEFFFVSITKEQAISIIISGGIIRPEK